MAKHVWSVLCRRAILDKSTNNVSLIDSLENIEFVPTKPLQEGRWSIFAFETTLVSFLVRSDDNVPEQPKIRVQLVAPDGKASGQEVIATVNLSEHTRARNFFQFQTMGFWSSGTHNFVVSLELENEGWEAFAEVPVIILQKPVTKTN